MVTATDNQTDLLTQIVNAGWVPPEQREPLFDRILELVSADAAKAQGNAAKDYQQSIVARIFADVRAFRIYDGPSEVHRWSLAKRIFKGASGA